MLQVCLGHRGVEIDQARRRPSRLWPSCTRIARTTPVSNGCMVLVRPLGMILPGRDRYDVDGADSTPRSVAIANTAMML